MIQIDYFQDTEDHIGTTGTVTLDGTPAEAFRKIAELTGQADITAIDITGQGFSQVHMVRAGESRDWIYQSIGA